MVNKTFLLFFLLLGCDFTPPLNKKILEAQGLIQDYRYQEAIKKYLLILEKNPPVDIKVKINYQIGDLYSIYLSRISEAVKFYRNVIEITNDNRWKIKSMQRTADLYFSHLKNFNQAISYYNRLLKIDQNPAQRQLYEFRTAQSHFKLLDFGKARKEFKKIQRSQSHQFNVRSFYYLGMIEFYEKNWHQTVKYLTEYINLEKNREEIVQAKFILANSLESRENLNKAYEIYYSILGEYPNTEVIRKKLDSIYKRRIARKRN